PAIALDGADIALTRPSACETACARHGVSWRYSELSSEASIWEEVDPTALLAFSQTISAALSRELLGAIPKRPTLVCPATDTGIGRMLILDHDRDAAQYLGAAVELCHQIGAKPIVLTIARSMRAALNRQQWAQSIVHGMGLSADFDVLAGREIRNTALAIARWRRC